MNKRAPKGFALLLTMVILAIVGTTLASLALRVHQRQQATVVERAKLQRQLITDSARHAVFQATAATPERSRQAQIQTRMNIGGYDVTLRWANENAKVNLNSLHGVMSSERLATAAADFASQYGGGQTLRTDNALRRFNLTASGATAQWPAYVSFDQLADRDDVARHLGTSHRDAGVFDRVTLWGSGRINPALADEATLTLAFQAVLAPGPSREAAEALAGRPLGSDTQRRKLLAQVGREFDDPQMVFALEDRLTQSLETQSLRVVIDDGRRRDVTLLIEDQDPYTALPRAELHW